jgi:hypothetical protein
MNCDLEQILEKTRSAHSGYWGVLSTGEKLVTALVLNRADWLDEAGYSIADALSRIGVQWASLIPEASRRFAREVDLEASAAEKKAREKRIQEFAELAATDEHLRMQGTLVTCGSAPGYRQVYLTLDLKPQGSLVTYRSEIQVRAADGESIVRTILDVHRLAWRKPERGPLDRLPGEVRPRWIGE